MAERRAGALAESGATVREARRRLVVEALGISVSAAAFAVVYGLAARTAGLSVPEAVAMSVFVFAGASQFASLGLIAAAAPWPAIIVLTGLLNARHLLYSAALLPWLRNEPRRRRAAMAHLLTDEAFALSVHHFGRLGRTDVPGYWIAAMLIFIPWNVGTIIGIVGGGIIPEPRRLGLDVVFPAAMAGLAVLLVHGRRDVVAVAVACAFAVVLGLAVDPAVGVLAGGLAGPLVAMFLVQPREPLPAAPEMAELESSVGAFSYDVLPRAHDEGPQDEHPQDERPRSGGA